MINIFLVDDHDLVRTGIRRILEDFSGIKVVGEASSGEAAVAWCRQHRCDIIFMDMNLPGIDGIETTRRILRVDPAARIIMLTVHTDDPVPAMVMKAGAWGYLTKGASAEEMIKAIREVFSGHRYLESDIAQMMALVNLPGGRKSDAGGNPFAALAERELQISAMISQGMKVGDIAERLAISPKTVNSYRYRVFRKLGIGGDVELTRLALRYGLDGVKQNF